MSLIEAALRDQERRFSDRKTKIAPWSKSGLCIRHGNLLRTRIANRNRRAKARAEA